MQEKLLRTSLVCAGFIFAAATSLPVQAGLDDDVVTLMSTLVSHVRQEGGHDLHFPAEESPSNSRTSPLLHDERLSDATVPY